MVILEREKKIPYKGRDINKERNVLLTRPHNRLYIHGLVASTEMNSILCFTFFSGSSKEKIIINTRPILS